MGRAAAHLGITQPALTQSLNRLERVLEAKLLERGPRGVVPTEAGHALAARARAILLEARLARTEIDAWTGRLRGRMRIGAGPSLAAGLVPAAVTRLIERHPEVHVQVIEGTFESLLPALEQGELDLVVGTQPADLRERGLSAEMLLQDSMVIAARAGHSLAALRTVGLRETLAFPWVLSMPEDVVREKTDAVFRNAGLAPPAPAVETTSASAIKALLAHGDYLSLIPRGLIALEEASAVLVALPVAGGPWPRTVHALFRTNALPPAGRLMVSLLRKVAES